jgi:hypothetical protein
MLKNGLLATAACALMSVAGASGANAITIAGVTFDAGFDIKVANLFENIITGNGQTLSGYGEVSSINGRNAFEFDGTGFCQGGCELTYVFGGFTSKNFNAGTGKVEFDGGWINFYVDSTPDFNSNNTTANNKIRAGDGTLWLTLAGHPSKDLISGDTAVIFGSGVNLGTGNDNGTGVGQLDVDLTGLLNGNTAGAGAAANGNFDTNGLDDNLGGKADFNLDSSFGNQVLPPALNTECHAAPPGSLLDPNHTCLAGSATLRGLAVPEPMTLGILGVSLLGLGIARRRKA